MGDQSPPTSLKLVQLDHIIQATAEQAYSQLKQLTTSIKDQPDEAK